MTDITRTFTLSISGDESTAWPADSLIEQLYTLLDSLTAGDGPSLTIEEQPMRIHVSVPIEVHVTPSENWSQKAFVAAARAVVSSALATADDEIIRRHVGHQFAVRSVIYRPDEHDTIIPLYVENRDATAFD